MVSGGCTLAEGGRCLCIHSRGPIFTINGCMLPLCQDCLHGIHMLAKARPLARQLLAACCWPRGAGKARIPVGWAGAAVRSSGEPKDQASLGPCPVVAGALAEARSHASLGPCSYRETSPTLGGAAQTVPGWPSACSRELAEQLPWNLYPSNSPEWNTLPCWTCNPWRPASSAQ